jgi:hypothetical protein
MTDVLKTPVSSKTVEDTTNPKSETSPRINFPVSGPLHLVVVLVPTNPLTEVMMKGALKNVVEWTAFNALGEKCKITSIGNFAQEIHDDFMYASIILISYKF